MYLKSLELHGFKSFPNKTVLQFERGTTVVVGPNGSGKSNISDAMRWVLGEISSRNIRGTRMEDVIFGGTDLRRPMSFAEVSVTFDNSDETHRIDSPYDEITVTRRYYRSGESEYMINRKNCRLRDIHELFMNTGVGREGYSIIGQGKIAEILSKKSEDRRNIFEEAAGISKFRQRKEETEKKLRGTEQNMDSLTLIFNELDARIGPLARDAEKAKKYRELLENKKRADVSLWLFDTEKIKTDLQAATVAFRLATAEYERLKESIDTLEKQSDHIHDQLTGRRLASEQFLTDIGVANKRIGALETAYARAVDSIAHLTEMAEQGRKHLSSPDEDDARLVGNRAENEEKKTQIERNIETLEGERLELIVATEALLAEAKALEKRLAEELDAIETLNKERMDLQVRLDVSEKAKADGADQGANILSEIDKYHKAEESLKAEVARCEKNTASYKQKISAAEAMIAEQGGLLADATSKREEKHQKLLEESGRLSGLAQRIDSLRRMEEHFEGYQQSVRFVMQEYAANASRFTGKIYGPVSKLISIDKEYITAIETALGQNLQNIVVESEETAKSCIQRLKQAGAGRATFYPISSIRAATETDEIRRAASLEGYVGRADKLVSFDSRYREIMEWLLLRTLVFKDIDSATSAAKKLQYRVRIVTLDGQLINAGGSFTGGSVRRDSGILSRSGEIDQLVKSQKDLEKQEDNTKQDIVALEKVMDEAKRRIADAEQTRDLLYTMSRAQFSELDHATAKLAANDELILKLTADYERLTGEGGRYASDIVTIREELTAVEGKIADLRESRAALEVQRQALLDEQETKNDTANDLKLRVALMRAEIESVDAQTQAGLASLEAHKNDRAATEESIRSYVLRIEELEKEKEENRTEYEAQKLALRELEDKRAGAEEEGSDFDRMEKELREKIRAANDEREKVLGEYNRSENKLNRLKEENERLENRLWDEYQISYEDAVALDYPAVTAANRSEMASLQSSCKSKIRELGNVNPGAIEEYDQVKGRHEELKVQLEDLNASRGELLDILSRVEREMRDSFSKTFDEINNNFRTVFAELFGGGEAELSLTDPEDVLVSGIEIKAAPPGKIIKSLSLLSGGEQTFVAIALIFAILKANPTPFCIFDEIEAALDEVNVDRFGKYVLDYSKETQFVLITHRRGTMEIGDRLYGITMPERGISRAVPLDVSEIESKQKELLA